MTLKKSSNDTIPLLRDKAITRFRDDPQIGTMRLKVKINIIHMLMAQWKGWMVFLNKCGISVGRWKPYESVKWKCQKLKKKSVIEMKKGFDRLIRTLIAQNQRHSQRKNQLT